MNFMEKKKRKETSVKTCSGKVTEKVPVYLWKHKVKKKKFRPCINGKY